MNYSVSKKTKYVTEVKDVREVILSANADLSYWQKRLKDEKFLIYDGHATHAKSKTHNEC